MDQNALHFPERRSHRLINKIKVGVFHRTVRTAAAKPHLRFASDVRLTRSINLVQKLDKALSFQFGEALRHSLSQKVFRVSASGHANVEVVDEAPAMIGAAEQAHGRGRVLENLTEPPALRFCFSAETGFPFRGLEAQIRHPD